MREIEIKLRLKDKDKLLKLLKTLDCELSVPIYQKDTVFIENDRTEITSTEGFVCIRIRETENKYILTYKKQKKHLSESKEIEFIVGDPEEVTEFLYEMNYKKQVIVEKTRIHSKYKDINICIDEVTKLGTFVELEIVTKDDTDIDLVEAKLYDTAKELELDPNDRVMSHYDTMIYELEKNSE